MVRTGTKTPEEVDRAKEVPAVEATAIVVSVRHNNIRFVVYRSMR